MQRDRTFTSYINAEVAAGAQQQADKLARIFDQSFDHIQRRAAGAARSTSNLVGGTAAPRAVSSSAIAEGTRLAAMNSTLVRSSQSTTTQIMRQAAATGQLHARNQNLIESLRSTATGLQVVQGPLGPLAGRVTALSNAVERLTGFRLGVVGVGAALFALTAAASHASELRNKLSPLYETQEQVNTAFRRTIAIAKDTRTALEPVVDLYSRLTLVGRAQNLMPQQIERVTRAAALGARLSGGAPEAQQAALTQLGQAIGSNRLGGDELRSILENAPRIATAIAAGLSNTEHFGKVTIGMLRTLGAEGQLTASRVAGALGRSLHQLEQEAQRLGPTIKSSMSAFGAELTGTISNLDQTIGLTRDVANVIQFAADNMRELLALTLGIASAWGGMKVFPALEGKIAGMRNFVALQRNAFEEQRRAAEVEQRAASASVLQLAQRNDSLRQQRTYIEANVAALEQEVRVRQATVNNLAPQAAMSGVTGGTGVNRLLAEETDRLAIAQSKLGRSYQALNGIQIAQATTSRGMSTALTREEQALAGAATASSRLKFWGGALLEAINPIGIVVAIATTALFEFALAESQAERNAKRLEEVQRQLADAFDDTTGRIREQNAEIRAGVAIRADEATNLAHGQFEHNAQGALQRVVDALTVQRGRVMPGVGQPLEAPTLIGGPGGEQAQHLLEEVRANRMGLIEFSTRLNRLAQRNPESTELQNAAAAIRGSLPDLQDRSHAEDQARAQARVARGSQDPEDLRRVRGDFSRGRVEGMTPAQLDAAAEAERRRLDNPAYRAATTRDRALQALEPQRAQLSAPEFIHQRAEILRTYDQEIAAIQRTERASQNRTEREAERARDKRQQLDNLMTGFQDDAPIRQLERVYDQAARAKGSIHDLIGEQVQGIGRFGAADAERYIHQVEAGVSRQSQRFVDDTMEHFQDDTPIRRLRELAHKAEEAKRNINALVGHDVGGRAFTAADAGRLTGQIDAYVNTERTRPLTDLFRQAGEQQQVQQLVLNGREAESHALEHAFQLQQSMGALTKDQYGQLIRNSIAEERINQIIAARERMVNNLVQAADDARQTIEATLGQLARGRPDQAIKTIFTGFMDSYFRTETRQLTERLMAGTDQRIRDLVSGRTQVDISVSQISTGMDTAGSAAMNFATRLQAAAQIIDAAAANAQAPGAPGGGAAAAPGSDLDTWLRSGSGPAGFAAGGGAGGALRILAPLASMVIGGNTFAQHVARGSSGVDLRAALGSQVHAPFDGTLTTAHSDRGGLEAFVTSMDGRVRMGFAHLNAVTVEGLRQGMQVAAHQVIAMSGNSGINPRTGRNVDPHLHTSLRIDGRSVDPMRYFGRDLTLPGGAHAAAASPLAGAATTMAMAANQIAGLLVPGNIDIMHRPRHRNPDGSISTVRSMSFGTSQGEVLVPTIAENGSLLSNRQAQMQYQRTGRHLGIFDSPEHADAYAQALHRQQEAMIRGATTLTDAMQRVKQVVDSLPVDSGAIAAGTTGAIAAGVTPGATQTQFTAVTGIIGDLHSAIAGPSGVAQGIGQAGAAAQQLARGASANRQADVRTAAATATKVASDMPQVRQNLGVRELYNNLGADIGKNLDHVLGTNFASKVGGKLGDVLAGAGKGQMASGVASMLGIKQSSGGAAIGGAIGQLAAPLLGPLAPFAPFIGGLIGGTIGGLFKKTPQSSSTVSVGSFGNFVTGTSTGSSSALRNAADQLGGSVGSGLKNIADALYGTVTGSGSVSIGERKGKFVVDPTGRGRTKGSGTTSYDTEEQAVTAAIKVMLQKGVIQGISAASETILQRGKDLQAAIVKAAAIEAIPRQLMQLTDPVRYAVTELNRQFSQLIDYLKEGGASAEQFQQAQKVYDISRQKAIQDAMDQASGAIQNFLNEMNAGQASPLNRRTVYSNAKEQIDKFQSDVMGGKVVDESKLLDAAQKFEDASRGLNGSNSSFFADFNWLEDLLKQARDNITGQASTTPLPDSPFASDPTIQALLGATQDQTGVLNGTLQSILDTLRGMGLSGGDAGSGSSIGLLPDFGGGGGGRNFNVQNV